MEPRIYLDYAATTPLHDAVIVEMERAGRDFFGNPSSLHSEGLAASQYIRDARAGLAAWFGGGPRDLVFTGSGTESLNLAIVGVSLTMKTKGLGSHIITSTIEHPGVAKTCAYLEQQGFEITRVAVDTEGILNLEQLAAAVRRDTVLITVMAANNEIGTIQPLHVIGAIASDHNIPFHTDAVQAFGKIPLDPVADQIHFVSAAAHKIQGPKGVGCLFRRDQGIHPVHGDLLQPVLFGAGHEFGLRPGTENTIGIAGFAKAAEIACSGLPAELERQTRMRDELIRFILGEFPGAVLHGHPRQRLPNNINFSIPGVDGVALALALDDLGVAVSTGAACHSDTREPSAVLMALGLEHSLALGSIRVSLGSSTTAEEVARFKSLLTTAVSQANPGP
jgi:cysteine desulfurase